MTFWWFMLCCDLLIPVIMIAAGQWMRKKPPKNINWFFGYRTARSMRSAETWDFAHRHCGRTWWWVGWALLLPSLAVHLPFRSASEEAISVLSLIVLAVQLAVLLCSVIPTERALKRTFAEDGTRKE